MIQGTATTWALSSLILVLLIYIVYFSIFFLILYIVFWALGWIFRPLIRILRYGR